nr:glycine--tRNA ligase subunit beta [Sodalis sp. CWE]
MKHTFLVEIGTEELPSKDLRALGEAFSAHIASELDIAKIHHGEIKWFATPLRLAVKITSLSNTQSCYNIEKRGPAISKSFDSYGRPTKEAESWARSCGITLNQATRRMIGKKEWLVYCSKIKGEKVKNLLCNIIIRAIEKLPITKMMQWNNCEVQFIRPVHSIAMLLDNDVVVGNILGIKTDRVIYGHRFMGKRKIILNHANEYPKILLDHGRVMADYLKRKEIIRKSVETVAKQLGGIVNLNENLLEEVTSLVEWPVVLSARFEEKFLSVPIDVLIYTMQNSQKYFPVYDSSKGSLLPYFIFVANIESKKPKKIIAGNEKVIRSRLADAKFFFTTDRKKKLQDYLPRLNTIVFQNQLGSLRDKSKRIETLAAWIADKIGANISQASRAGLLSKCDLVTNMVSEFSEMQGIIGMHYARYDGESEEVALAQKEQYQPQFFGDLLPTTLVSCSVSIADKMDTLVGIFGTGYSPKGDKDPFALRRAALGVLRIIIEKKLFLDLEILTKQAVQLFGKKLAHTTFLIKKIIDFILSRFFFWYQEKGYNVDVIQAVLSCHSTVPTDLDARIRAINSFCMLKEAKSLVLVNKRISKILIKSSNLISNKNINFSLFKKPEEIKLAICFIRLQKTLKPLLESGRYQDALKELLSIDKPVNFFFERITIMSDDFEIRTNRIFLLKKLQELILKIADISFLQI